MEASDDVRKAALEQVKKKRDFSTHLVSYFAVALLWGIWLVIGLTDDFTFPWPAFVTAGWGIGVVMNAWDVYGRKPITDRDIEDEVARIQRGE